MKENLFTRLGDAKQLELQETSVVHISRESFIDLGATLIISALVIMWAYHKYFK